jgi:hypothetical protein
MPLTFQVVAPSSQVSCRSGWECFGPGEVSAPIVDATLGGFEAIETEPASAYVCQVYLQSDNIVWSSNAPSCSWRDNFVAKGALPCSGSAPLTLFAPGRHFVQLVYTAPNGAPGGCLVEFVR